jgi:flagellar hook-associated protein 1 FlgK
MNLITNALSGVQAAQIALGVTSQNVANAATPGYTRQGALFVAAIAMQSGGLSAGSGVTVPSLLRFSDSYTSRQMWRSNSDVGEFNSSQPYLSQMEQVMGDDSSNLSNGFDNFFSALNAVSTDPTSSPLRQQVITSAQALAQRFSDLNGVMTGQLTSVHQQRASTVDQINQAATAIAALNKQIAAAQATNVNASGLIDTRDQQIDALASLVGIQVVDQADGSRSVSLVGGQPLVAGASAATMAVQGNADGSQSLTVKFAQETFALPDGSLGGQLGGLNDYEENVLAPLRQSISDLAGQFSSAVNSGLSAGYGTDGSAGRPLFDFDPATGTLSVDPGAQAANLGFSSDPTKPGNSDNLMGLIDLNNQTVTIGSIGTVRLGDANTQLVGQLGTQSQQNQASLATAQTVRDQSVENWKSVSGVNSDEEATNLVQYQQMYQANMKVISVADTLFQSTLSMMS